MPRRNTSFLWLPVVIALGAFAFGSRSWAGATSQMECPFRFQSEMPPGVFCVYAGRVTTPEGRTCGRETAAIWSNHGLTAPASGGMVSLGFVDAPDTVLLARTGPRGDRASVAFDAPDPNPSSGELTLNRQKNEPETLAFAAGASGALDIGGCTLGSFRGVFVGVLAVPVDGE